MRTKFIEATNGINWGKFAVCRFEPDEIVRESVIFPGRPVLLARGWSGDELLVIDLETCEGAAFRHGGYAKADLQKHKIWVCPLFEPFLTWLYTQDVSDLDALRSPVTLPATGFLALGPSGRLV